MAYWAAARFQPKYEKLALHFDQFLMHRIGFADENRLHALGAITDPRGFDFVNNQIAKFKNAHARSRKRAPDVFP